MESQEMDLLYRTTLPTISLNLNYFQIAKARVPTKHFYAISVSYTHLTLPTKLEV